MKTSDLFLVLSKKEVLVFYENVIKNHKRKTLQKLFEYFKKGKSLSKEKLFRLVFEQIYTNSKDHLLRNELRLLNQEIELFLVQQNRLKNINSKLPDFQLDLLEIFLQKKQFHLFEQTWRKLFKKATKERWYTVKIDLAKLYFDYQTQQKELDFEAYHQLDFLLTDTLSIIVAHWQEVYKTIQQKKAFVQKVEETLKPNYKVQENIEHYAIYTPSENQDFLTYMDAYIEAYTLSGTEKIEHLKEVLKLQQPLLVYSKYKDLNKEHVLIQSTIALEYFLLRDYQSADDYYQTFIHQPINLPLHKKAGLYFNYFSNLIGLEAYERATDWFEQSSDDWKENPTTKYRLYYLLSCAYVMQGAYEKAQDLLLTHNIAKRPENDFLYARVLLAIILYSMGEEEDAERELYNLKQRNRYQTPQEAVFILYADFFYQYIKIDSILDKQQQQKKLQSLSDALEEANQQNAARRYSMFFYKWMRIELKKKLTPKDLN